jgi:threonine aldolase
MCNQIAMHAFVRSGHFAVCEAGAHTGRTEAASSAVLSGIAFQRLTGVDRGRLTAAQIEAALAPDPSDVMVTDLVTIENTHLVGGGSVLPVSEVQAISAVCTAHGVPLYLDGARIFNACTVSGAALADYGTAVTAMMFCLSKGLGAPVGSVLAGDREFIREARRLKILFGGAWRQAGILAAAGLVALEEGPKRLHQDHENARRLAEGVADLLPGSVDLDGVVTNIVFAGVPGGPARWVAALAAEGLLVSTVGGRVRMVTHVGIGAGEITAALAAWQRAAKTLS